MLVLLAIDGLFLIPVLAWRVVYDFLLSWSLTLVLVLAAMGLSVSAVDAHARVRMARVLSGARKEE